MILSLAFCFLAFFASSRFCLSPLRSSFSACLRFFSAALLPLPFSALSRMLLKPKSSSSLSLLSLISLLKSLTGSLNSATLHRVKLSE